MKYLKFILLAAVLSGRFGVGAVNWKARQSIATYPSLGLTYNRIKKNANTTVVTMLREMTTGRVEGRKEAKKLSQRYSDLTFAQIWALRQTFFFVVVRNPYSRVLSAFLEKFQHDSYHKKFGAFDRSPAGFAAFLEWLESDGLDKNYHWDLQTKLLLLPLDKYDRVIRFESLKEDMTSMFASLGMSAPLHRLDGLYPTDVNKKTSASSRLHEFYTPRLAGIVARLYATDFERLGYSPDFPRQDSGEGG